MTVRLRQRLKRYAICSALTVPLELAIVAGLPLDYAFAFVLAVSLPMFWACGPFQADVSLNTALDERDRVWWRIALYLVPGAMALYWHWHLRD
ncbi:MAG: hypothetical protein JWQ18_1481 [Conexibacter sp.]|nr:hypothetical protein [Conexibacter sp.]